MLDVLIRKASELGDALVHGLLFFSLGALIGFAQLLGGAERVTLRLAVARACTVGGLAVSAGAVLIWDPTTPLIGQIGLAAVLASLGTSGLERLFARVLSRRG